LVSWFAVDFTPVLFNQHANAAFGLATMFRGQLGIAEAMSPGDPITIVQQKPEWKHICGACFEQHLKPLFERMSENEALWKVHVQTDRT
jgi:hypothetical protein